MATESARLSLYEVGYRRSILLLGALWGAAPALSFGLNAFGGLSSPRGLLAIGALMTVSLGVLYELDSRKLDQRGEGVPLAWSYALVAPISAVFWATFRLISAIFWATFGPLPVQIPGAAVLGIFVGPPASALLYLWQRGRVASVR